MTTSGNSSSKDRLGLAGFCLYLAIGLLPLAASFLYGGLYSIGLAGLLKTGVTAGAWRVMLSSGELWGSFLFSFYVAAAVMSMAVVCALALALSIPGEIRRGFLSYALFVPLALPAAVAAFLALQTLGGSGLLARVALRTGIIADAASFPSLVHDPLGVGVVLAHLLLTAPFFTLLFVELHETQRVSELTALARTLGASRAQCFVKVALPILLTSAGSNLCLAFVVLMGSYEIPLLLGRQSPEMLSVLTLRKFAMYDLSQKPEAFVVALLYTLVTASLVLALKGRAGARDVR